MYTKDERRQHLRASVAIPMTLNFGGDYLDVVSINLSEGGALVEIPASNLSNRRLATEGARGYCFFEFEGLEFESDIFVIRQIQDKIAFKFKALTADHVSIIGEIIKFNL